MYTTANKYHKLPSEIIDERGELPLLTRYLVNKAVTYFGMVMDNALAETVEVGLKPNVQLQPKYTLAQLLSDEFRLPRPKAGQEARKAVGQQVKALFGSGKPKRKGKEQAKPAPLLQKWLERHGGKVA